MSTPVRVAKLYIQMAKYRIRFARKACVYEETILN